jgi:hypothetical protein
MDQKPRCNTVGTVSGHARNAELPGNLTPEVNFLLLRTNPANIFLDGARLTACRLITSDSYCHHVDSFEGLQLHDQSLETHLICLRQLTSLGKLQCNNTRLFLDFPKGNFQATSFTSIGIVIRRERSDIVWGLRGV